MWHVNVHIQCRILLTTALHILAESFFQPQSVMTDSGSVTVEIALSKVTAAIGLKTAAMEVMKMTVVQNVVWHVLL